MSLPPLAPIPPSKIRLALGPVEWEACLDAWLTLVDLHLRLPIDRLASTALQEASLQNFITSYFHEHTHVDQGDDTLMSSKARLLQRQCLKLVKRLTEVQEIPSFLSAPEFVTNLCQAHLRNPAIAVLVDGLWKRRDAISNDGSINKAWQLKKNELISQLESKASHSAQETLRQLAPVFRASAEIGAFFMTGSDFVDALASEYVNSLEIDCRKPIVSIAYLGLVSLTKTEPPHLPILADHLYGLKNHADNQRSTATLLNDLVTNTPLVARLRRSVHGDSVDRLVKLLNQLETYQTPSLVRPRKHARDKASNGKGRQEKVNGDLHVHRMSLVTQIQDLFPDLGSAFVLRLLDEYDDNVEQVTAHLLDESLPAHLKSLDRTEQAPVFGTDPQEGIEHLLPRSTPPPPEPYIPDRRNVFDDDELDRLELDTARLHIGKREQAESRHQPNKAAILSALAAFDSDDDERDDTYDVEDVGGTVDTAQPDDEPDPAQGENEMALFTAYKSSPELFGRTFGVRRGQGRQALKAETGMTDEAIEGWAIMLQRDPMRVQKLETRSGHFDGRQTELASTAYRESAGGTETEDSDASGAQRGGSRGRRSAGGRGNRGGRGRGNAAGPSSDPSTATAQRRKEANKSSRANHNRRDQRARKMARGGGGLPG